MEWYLRADGQQLGPLSPDDLPGLPSLSSSSLGRCADAPPRGASLLNGAGRTGP